MLRPAALFLAAGCAAAGCTGPAALPPAPPAASLRQPALADSAAPPGVRVVVGRPETVAVDADFARRLASAGARSDGPVRVEAVGPGRLAVVAEEPGLHLVAITDTGGRVLAVHAVPAAGAAGPELVLRVLGTAPGDPSQLRLAVREVDARGRESPPTGLDDDEGVVALDGDRLLDDNAVYFDPDVGELAVDLDALGGGRRTLWLAARDGARVSRWAAVPVQDGRLVTR